MLEIEIKELIMSNELKKKIEMICKFSNTKPTFFNGCIINIKSTNIAYLKPHSVVINEITYLFIDNSDYVFIENLNKKIKLSELKNHLKKTDLTK